MRRFKSLWFVLFLSLFTLGAVRIWFRGILPVSGSRSSWLRALGFDSRLELEWVIMNREKTLRYVLIAVGALILALLALQFWVVKNKRYIFQGTVSLKPFTIRNPLPAVGNCRSSVLHSIGFISPACPCHRVGLDEKPS